MSKIWFLVFASALCAAQTPTLEQTLALKTASAPHISPDGRTVAYVVTEADWVSDSFSTQIWTVPAGGGERRVLTHGKGSSREPRWSPDSRRVAYVSDRDGSAQIYVAGAAGGEPVQLTRIEGGVENLEWSPDGRRIAFTSRRAFSPLWTIRTDVAKATPELLVSGGVAGELNVGGFRWSPDSQTIALSAGREAGLAGAASTDIYTVSIARKAMEKIVGTPGPDVNPVWSPDGSEIAYETADGRDGYLYLNRRIAIVPALGGPPRLVARSFDENPHLAGWARSGLYFEAAQKTAAHLFRVDARTGVVERVSAPGKLILGEATVDSAGSTSAFTCAGPNAYAEICVSGTAKFAARVLTNFGEQFAAWRPATREVFEWASRDGTPLEGILIKPADFDPAKKYPLFVVLHGGPVAVDRPSLSPDRNYPLELFAAKGAVILRPNYRGSAGYGEKFRSANVRKLGVGDAQDVLSAVDALVARGFIDGDRVGAMGWSEGGYIAAFLGTSTRRFKAVSVGAGISDWATYFAGTDLPEFARQYLGAAPWQDPGIYQRLSPITYVGGASTATLIQHGDQDPRVPLANAYELYHGLKDLGAPVKMIVYPGTGHAVDRPKEQLAVMEQNYQWFREWLWGEKPSTPF